MAVTIDDVRHIAALARLHLTEAHAQSLVGELNAILDHVGALGNVDTSDAPEVSGIGASGTPLRSDVGPQMPLAHAREEFAPRMRDGFFLVPRLASHEDAGEET